MKKTAIEWLESMLPMVNNNDPYLNIKNILNQAREMEKQRMKEMYSEEEVYDILIHHTVELFKKEPITLEGFWNKFKKK